MIISKLKKHNLLGRGGANFPTGLKWEMVKKAKSDQKYIICNAAESEPKTKKDEYILAQYGEEVIAGIKLALNTIPNSKAYIYLKPEYYKKYKNKLNKLIKNLPITFLKKTGGYLCGEETTLINDIEGKRLEPRIRPPFPPQSGLWGMPTLINNVETFYYAAKIAQGKYNNTRFYSLEGDIKNKGVYELPTNLTIKEVLKKTDNYPVYKFFIQAGGGASGAILFPSKLNAPVKGAGSIIVYNLAKTNILKLMKKWVKFFHKENCNKCAPCREGVYRILEMLRQNKINKKEIKKIFYALEESSFCALGKSVPSPLRELINKI